MRASLLLAVGLSGYGFRSSVAQTPAVVISEAVASNHATLLDEDGDAADWLELRNTSGEPVALEGWSLTTGGEESRRWMFGKLVLPASGRQVVFCSGKNRWVRDDAVPPPADPGKIPGLAVWLDAGSIDPSDSVSVQARDGRQFVRRWTSRTQPPLTFEQAHDPSQPEWRPAVFGGRPALRFTESFSGLASEPVAGAMFAPHNEVTVLVVQRNDGPAQPGSTLFWQSSPTNRLNLHAVWWDGNFYFDLGDASRGGRLNYPSPDHFLDRWTLLSAVRTPALRAELRLEGRPFVDQPVRTSFEPAETASLQVGVLGFTGWIAEIVVYARALEPAELAGVERFLGRKYGMDLPRQEWHTDFELDRDGELVRLHDPSGAVVDVLRLQRAPVDVAQGRSEDLANTGFLAVPTPGEANTAPLFAEQLPAPVLSRSTGHYPEPFRLEAWCPAGGPVIRFTLDGSNPGPDDSVWPGSLWIGRDAQPAVTLMHVPTNPSQHVQEDGSFSMPDLQRGIFGWLPPAPTRPGAVVVSLRAFQEGWLPSERTTATYFVGPDRPAPTPLATVSLVVDPREWFDARDGLYVPGSAYDPARWTGRWWWGTGNYFTRGPGTERVARFVLINGGASVAFDGDVGVRVHGGGTRAEPMKSLMLHARARLGTRSMDLDHLTGSPTRYERLVLRNSGQDSVLMPTLMRQALFSDLAREIDPAIAASAPVVVYLNGEYWGIHHLTEDYGPQFFARWGIGTAALDCLDDGQVEAGDAWGYLEAAGLAESSSGADPAAYATLARKLDLEAFAEYLITEIYSANSDWPHNHINCWRVRAADGQAPGVLGDGRWRWLLTDMDATFGLGGRVDDDTLARLLEPGTAGQHLDTLLRFLLANPEFRHLFLTRFADRLNRQYATSTVLAAIDRLADLLRPAMGDHAARWGRPATTAAWENELAVLRDFATRRPSRLRALLSERFDLGEESELAVGIEPAGAGTILVNSLRVEPGTATGPWRGTYFRRLPVDLRCLPSPGYRFRGWQGLPAEAGAAVRIEMGNPMAIVAVLEVDPDAPPVLQPTPHVLASGPYVFTTWSSQAPAGSHPDHMELLQSAKQDPALGDWDGVATTWSLGFALSSRSRFLGLGTDGLGFVNTSNPQDSPGAGYVGSVVLGLDTRGVSHADLSWVTATLSSSQRPYALRVQWRPGNTGPFLEWGAPAAGEVWQRESGTLVTGRLTEGPRPLPPQALGLPYVQVRWVYHAVSPGGDGPRPLMLLDDVVVSREELPPSYLAWLAERRPNGIPLTYELAALEADPDGDGAPNLLEYASGTAPGDSRSLPVWRIQTGGQQNGFFWRMEPPVPGGLLVLQDSPDLRTWRDVSWPEAPVQHHDGAVWKLARLIGPGQNSGEPGHYFLRVGARLSP